MLSLPTIIRSKSRRRTVALRVAPDGQLVVQAPARVSLKWIEAFIASKARWIARRREEQKAKAAAPRPAPLADGALVPFMGQMLRIEVEGVSLSAAPIRHSGEGRNPDGSAEGTPFHNEEHSLSLKGQLDPGLRRDDEVVILTLPASTTPETMAAELRTELTLWYKRQARTLIPARAAHWAEIMGVTPSRVTLSSPSARWGSCNATNEIRINWRLIMAAPEILDYVIVHELAHIPHKNHGPRFWRLVEKHIPDCKSLRKALHTLEKDPFQTWL